MHVLAAGAEAKFDLKTGSCLAVRGFSNRTVKQLAETVRANQEFLSDAWSEYEGEE